MSRIAKKYPPRYPKQKPQWIIRRWNPVSDGLPDSDITVQIACASGDEPVWLGYHDGECWLTVAGDLVTVSHWTEMLDAPVP
jgi:hypothetical protein